MSISIYLWSFLADFFLEWEMFQTKFVEKIETRISCSIIFFPFGVTSSRFIRTTNLLHIYPMNATQEMLWQSLFITCTTCKLTLVLLMWRIGWAPNSASRWQMGLKSAFKGLRKRLLLPQFTFYIVVVSRDDGRNMWCMWWIIEHVETCFPKIVPFMR